MELSRAEVLSNRRCGLACLVEFDSPGIASSAGPGQFVHVLCGSDSGRVLRRPYSIFSAGEGRVAILLKRVGPGSEWLAEREPGDALDVLGPLGRAFPRPGEGNTALVAGGTGIAPLHFMASSLAAGGRRARLFWGMEGGEDFGSLPGDLAGCMELEACSMDGLRGEAETVLDRFFSTGIEGYSSVYACGPVPMLKRLEGALSGTGTPLEVCLEERMACGLGACQGCAVPVRSTPGGYKMACREGPAFPAHEIDWERMA